MSFVRPEAARALVRWREAALWVAVLAAGLLLTWRGYHRLEPLTFVVGVAAAGTGGALLKGALARLRLGTAPPGPGVVVVDEGRIGLLGPHGGGFVDLAALVSVAVEGAPGTPERAWVLVAEDGGRLTLPFGAAGAEAAPDALAALPGIDFAAAEEGPAVVWRRLPRPRSLPAGPS